MKNKLIFLFFTLYISFSVNAQKVLQFNFDDINGATSTVDSISNTSFNITNNFNRPERISGLQGNALRLDGWSTWIKADNYQFSSVSDEMTVEAWYATEAHNYGSGGIISQISGPAGFSLEVDKFGYVIWAFHADGQFYFLKSSIKVVPYKWYHIVGIIDLPNQSAQIQINGQTHAIAQLGNHSTITLANSTPLYIGRQTNEVMAQGFNVSILNGALDEVSVYDYILPNSIITQTAQQGALTDINLEIDASYRHQGDNLRPQYHPMPNTTWTNEPYGLIFHNGQYHLFFQKNPNTPQLYFMHWGHLSSPDLVNWKEERIPLAPDDLPGFDNFGIWAGDAIIDAQGNPKLIYTGVNGAKAAIGTAFPADTTLNTWYKDVYNPIILGSPNIIPNMDFRDPYVWEESGTYHMIIGSGKANNAGGILFYYQSNDMAAWNFIGSFYSLPASTTNGIFWEMPFVQKINATEYLLGVVPTPNNGVRAKVIYWIGTIQNNAFVPNDPTPKDFELITENFLSPAVGRDTAGNSTYIGIIPEDRDVNDQIAAGWRQTFSIARIFDVVGNELKHRPHPNIQNLRKDHFQILDRYISKGSSNNIPEIAGNQMELKFSITPDTDAIFAIFVYTHLDGQEKTRIVFNTRDNRISVDKNSSTLSNALKDTRTADYNFTPNATIDVNIFLDHSTLEVFVNNDVVMSNRVYPSRLESDKVDFVLYNAGATIDSLDAWQIANDDSLFTGVLYNSTKQQFLDDSEFDFNIYPNPTNGDFNVSIQNYLHKNYAYQILNTEGKIIQSSSVKNKNEIQNIAINLNEPAGIYYLHFIIDGKTKTAPFYIVK